MQPAGGGMEALGDEGAQRVVDQDRVSERLGCFIRPGARPVEVNIVARRALVVTAGVAAEFVVEGLQVGRVLIDERAGGGVQVLPLRRRWLPRRFVLFASDSAPRLAAGLRPGRLGDGAPRQLEIHALAGQHPRFFLFAELVRVDVRIVSDRLQVAFDQLLPAHRRAPGVHDVGQGRVGAAGRQGGGAFLDSLLESRKLGLHGWGSSGDPGGEGTRLSRSSRCTVPFGVHAVCNRTSQQDGALQSGFSTQPANDSFPVHRSR